MYLLGFKLFSWKNLCCYSLMFCEQIPIKAPARARGELDITYLDEELR